MSYSPIEHVVVDQFCIARPQLKVENGHEVGSSQDLAGIKSWGIGQTDSRGRRNCFFTHQAQ